MNRLLNDGTGIREERTVVSISWIVLGMMALASISVVGCGSDGRPNVAGKWFDSSRCLKVEFFKDGTVNFTSLSGDDRAADVLGGEYRPIDKKHIRLESPLLGPTSGPVACEIEFSGRHPDTLRVRVDADRVLLLERLTGERDSALVGAAGLHFGMYNLQVYLEQFIDEGRPCSSLVHFYDTLVATKWFHQKNPYTGLDYRMGEDLFFFANVLPPEWIHGDSVNEPMLAALVDSLLRWRAPGTIVILGRVPTDEAAGRMQYAILSYGWNTDEPNGWYEYNPYRHRYFILHS